MSNAATVRQHLHDSIQATIALDEELPEGAMLLGWVTVAEWMAPDGNRWLSRIDGNAQVNACPSWQTQGYLHNALFDGDGFIPDDDDD